MRWLACLLACLLAACSAPTSTGPTSTPPTNESAPKRDKVPIVDSHVHLAYYPVASQLVVNGIDAVVDLAAPESALDTKYPLPVIQSGPMLTRPNGYPLDSWGADGYGIGCADLACIDAAITRLQSRGARVIKIALDAGGLDWKLATHATRVAHAAQLKVVVHALSDASARRAAEMDADVLAHTPLEPLSVETIVAWRTASERRPRAVISTLAAFSGSEAALSNLSRLRDAGMIVLYGTDLGNFACQRGEHRGGRTPAARGPRQPGDRSRDDHRTVAVLGIRQAHHRRRLALGCAHRCARS